MSFITLPREIRDQIYTHVFLYRPYTTTTLDRLHNTSISSPAPALLLVSKEINSEVLVIFYGQPTFNLYTNSPCPPHDPEPRPRLNENAISNLRSVRVSTIERPYYQIMDEAGQILLQRQWDAMLTMLLRLTHPRRTCTITLKSSTDSPFDEDTMAISGTHQEVVLMHNATFIEGAKKLVGFESVVLEFRVPSKPHRRPWHSHIQGGPYSGPGIEDFVGTRGGARAVLEPFLGPGEVYSVNHPGTTNVSNWCVKFEPRRFRAKELAGPEESETGLT